MGEEKNESPPTKKVGQEIDQQRKSPQQITANRVQDQNCIQELYNQI